MSLEHEIYWDVPARIWRCRWRFPRNHPMIAAHPWRHTWSSFNKNALVSLVIQRLQKLQNLYVPSELLIRKRNGKLQQRRTFGVE